MELEEQLNEGGGGHRLMMASREVERPEVPGEAEPAPCPGSSKQTLISLSSVQI